ncbi:MAG: ABC transporter ATP-binding protein [Bacteroidales bacterium]|jgi:ABC-type multidrug transport system ATPase subunit|nr:ABC transporter ATP-binding protein [Bacteroidales bacterium]
METIYVRNISKSYQNGKIEAVKDISFSAKKGKIFGIIGPDGAGKTTLFRILTTLLLPSSGIATVAGYDIVKDFKQIRKEAGYMPGRFSLYQDLSVEENLKVFASIFNVSVNENYYLIKDMYQQIEPFKTRKARALSGGMKQKLALCCALIHKPKILFLDEPTTGVDPVSRKELWEMLKRLKEQNITILVSTPYMDEASLCDKIALMMKGHFLEIETPDNVIGNYKEILWSVQSAHMSKLLVDLKNNPNIKTCFTFGETHHVTVSNAGFTPDLLKQYLELKNHTDISIQTIQANIEDCVLNLINRQSDEHTR